MSNAARRLREVAREGDAEFALKYFKTGPGEYGEGDRFIGVRAPAMHALAKEFEGVGLEELDVLLRSEWHEERMLALLILVRQYERGDVGHRERIFRFYLEHLRWVNNWDLVDASAAYIVGPHLETGDRSLLRELARSSVLWERRVAVLATLHFIRRGEYGETLALAEMLLGDREDLIHKAVGWMLREVGKRDEEAEEAFLRAHHRVMPRTMLRYAIERFPEEKRRRFMARR